MRFIPALKMRGSHAPDFFIVDGAVKRNNFSIDSYLGITPLIFSFVIVLGSVTFTEKSANGEKLRIMWSGVMQRQE